MRSIIALALALVPACAWAQAPENGYVSDHWTTDTGLPQNSVNAILQSRDGYLWIATNGGIARFDGSAFTIITSANNPGLPSDRIVGLVQDRAGRIWVGVENGLARYERGHFTTIVLRDTAYNSGINAIVAHPDGSVWLALRSSEVIRVDERGSRVVVDKRYLDNSWVQELAVDSSGQVWATSSAGLWRLYRDGHSELVRPRRRAQVRAFLIADARDGVWTATDSGIVHVAHDGIHDYPIRRQIADPLKVCKPGPECGPWKDDIDIHSAIAAAPNLLYLGTRAGEVWRFRVDSAGRAGSLLRVLAPQPGKTTVLTVDREANVWAGSEVSGLARLRPALFAMRTAADGLVNDVSNAVLTDDRGRVWVGGNCGGVSIIDRDTTTRLTKSDGLQHECVWSLAKDKAGAIWLGTHGGGLGRWYNGQVTWYRHPDDPLPNNTILSLYNDRNDRLWIGGETGISTWDGHRFNYDERTRRYHVRTFQQLRDGSMLIGTESGLLRYDKDRLAVVQPAGMPRNYVRAIYQDSSGTVWLGTYGGGLVRYRDNNITVFTTANGLFDDVVSSIIEDGSGNLWLSGNRGIFRIPRRELDAYAAGKLQRVHSVEYGRRDGMLSSETNGGFEPAVTRTSDGRLWYPTVRGVAIIDPAKAQTNIVPPSVVLEKLTENGRLVNRPDTLRLGPGAVDVELTYSGLSFTAPDAVTFRYRLEGWDKNWVQAGTRRTAYYSRLRPGHYDFQVAAANRDGVWSAPSTYSFAILPHFWQTWWFRGMAILLIACLIALSVRARLRALQRATAATILESITDGFFALDEQWRFTFVNRTAEELLRQPRAGLLGHDFFERFPRARDSVIEERLRAVMTLRTTEAFEAPDTPSYGHWLEMRVYPRERGLSVYFSDITTRKDAEDALRTLSLKDELTGVYNRRGFLAIAEQQAIASERGMAGLHIVFVDMDGMKRINDTLGHPMGDQALQDTVELMQRVFRKGDAVGRLGGDEFAAAIVGASEETIQALIDRLMEQLRLHNEAGLRPYELSLSVGVSQYDAGDPRSITELIEMADQKMYEAKKAKGSARA